MPAVTTWRGWYLFFDRIKNSRDGKLNHTRRVSGLDKLVESGNDPRDSGDIFIGHTETASRTLVVFVVFVLVCWAQSDH